MFKNNSKKYLGIIGILIVCFFISSYKLPYYITKPGSAMELSPIVLVTNGDEAEQGEFMLTTVLLSEARVLPYLFAKMKDYYYIYEKEQLRAGDETDEEYHVRQLYLMSSAKLNAIETAFSYANLEYDKEYKGVYVLNVLDALPASKVLQAGDSIIELEGKKLTSSDDLIQYVASKNIGEKVSLTIQRKEITKNVEVELAEITSGKVGIGITLVDDKVIHSTPEVSINSSDIGGPSAGLMFTLEIYSQLQEGDLTKGYLIAGTGTISSEGIVGPIGGVDQKVVAAHKSGADIFFAPLDNGNPNSDYVNAVKTAKEINSKMQIVGVNTFEEAVEYLNTLEVKE